MAEIWNLSTLCRCCHADGHFKSLNISYQCKNVKEIYENMLQDTLGVNISTPPLEASYTICDQCILRLRDASDFKKQVLTCEQKFLVYCKNEQFVDIRNIKTEEDNDDTDFCQDDTYEVYENLTMHVTREYNMEVDMKYTTEEKVKKENLTKSEMENVTKNTIVNETGNKTRVLKKTLRIRRDRRKNPINRQKYTKSKDRRKKRVDLDRQFIIQVDTDKGTQFSCKYCGELYETQKDINQHISKSHATIFKCTQCPKQFKSDKSYKNHLILHTGKDIKCSLCPKKFASKPSLRNHLNRHTRQKQYKCDLCQKDFQYKQTLIRHLKIHYGTNKKILCDLCGWSFNDQSNLNAHVKSVHLKLRPFHCKICKKSYSNKRHLNDHLVQVHNGGEKVLKCDVCDHRLLCAKSMKIHRLKHDNKFMCKYCLKIFEDMGSRREHVKAVHHKEHPWHSCTFCGKIFSHKYSFDRHVNAHSGIHKFSCDVCGLKFSQKAVLDRHIFRKHNPDADINIGKTKCDICKRSFKNIAVHMDSHNKRGSACDICGKTYPHNSALNKHKSLKHFGVTFDCDICEKKYSQKGKLNTHKMKVHKMKIKKVGEEGS